jgi:hypothetical protein
MDFFTSYIAIMNGVVFTAVSFIAINGIFESYNKSGWVRPFLKNRLIASAFIGFGISFLIFA